MGDQQIKGREGLTWEDSTDLVALANPAEKSPFTRWATGRFLTFFHYVWGFKHKVS